HRRPSYGASATCCRDDTRRKRLRCAKARRPTAGFRFDTLQLATGSFILVMTIPTENQFHKKQSGAFLVLQ
ncbi:MAG: hypothetical protein JW883_00025, partial [Deltaproteobacteria bacterium]|nr:hypothetical protein [Deltaproteobacteria bacterium]